MLCPLCRGRVDLLAKTCVCGFDIEANDPAEAILQARRDLKMARRLLLMGLAGAIGTVLLIVLVKPQLSWVDWFTRRTGNVVRIDRIRALVGIVPMLVPLSAFYGFGRGTWLFGSARRRLAVANRMQQLPVARLV